MMDNARNLLHNAVNLGYVGAVWVNLVNDAVAIIAGVTLVWWNVEKALHERKKRNE
jgi:hypothetical protein